ncbi:uncharacterized protein F5Z01DRAFT_692993 [Emericellopsis atlantica]|uniref:NmrA-like domain-containing protein n=1 Tax=Emericellopsis atlantica TaxID=2614577 RepID=A0A9P8CSG3_9HYPO|nr:uncharacterized protein F5Z01DRAFT_692993 [Emericellopsis atlantica]KAG9258059.1 hypothetical protein F5Z01DRAFT_692993 [Emericellopsis atlantica]
MSSSIKNVLIIGASGNVGRAITDAFLRHGGFNVSALTRSSSSSTFAPEVTVIRTAYTLASLIDAFTSQHAVVCAIGTVANANLENQRLFIHAAEAAGVKKFIPTEFTLDTSDERVVDLIKCCIMKRDTVDKLREVENRVEWTAVSTGPWVDWMATAPAEEWPWWDLSNKTFVKFDDGNTPFDASSHAQVGKAIVATLLPENREATKNQHIFIRSFRLTQNQVLEIFEKTTGSPWTVVPNSIGDVGKQGRAIYDEITRDGGISAAAVHPELGGKLLLSVGLMISAGIFGLGNWCQFEDKAKFWMNKLGLEDEDPVEVLSKAIR